MKLTTTIEDTLIAGAKNHFESSQTALRKSCKHALLTGLHLAALHVRTANQGARNDRTSGHVSGSLKGFAAACDEIGIQDRTARRWMNACAGALVRAAFLSQPADIVHELPELGTPKWEMWEEALEHVAEGVSISRLLLGQVKDGTEEYRMHRLITEAEGGDNAAEELLKKIAEGTMTSAQAIRAAAGLLATKDKTRKDPVYLDFDAVEKKPVGLIPKAFVTLENGFAGWEDYDEDAKELLKTEWIKVAKRIPSELLRLIKVGGVA